MWLVSVGGGDGFFVFAMYFRGSRRLSDLCRSVRRRSMVQVSLPCTSKCQYPRPAHFASREAGAPTVSLSRVSLSSCVNLGQIEPKPIDGRWQEAKKQPVVVSSVVFFSRLFVGRRRGHLVFRRAHRLWQSELYKGNASRSSRLPGGNGLFRIGVGGRAADQAVLAKGRRELKQQPQAKPRQGNTTQYNTAQHRHGHRYRHRVLFLRLV